MTDQTSNATTPAVLPPAAVPVVDRLAHLAAGAAAAFLVSHGMLAKSEVGQFVSVDASILLMVAGLTFSWLRGRLEHSRLAAALGAKA